MHSDSQENITFGNVSFGEHHWVRALPRCSSTLLSIKPRLSSVDAVTRCSTRLAFVFYLPGAETFDGLSESGHNVVQPFRGSPWRPYRTRSCLSGTKKARRGMSRCRHCLDAIPSGAPDLKPWNVLKKPLPDIWALCVRLASEWPQGPGQATVETVKIAVSQRVVCQGLPAPRWVVPWSVLVLFRSGSGALTPTAPAARPRWTAPRILTIMVMRWDHEDGQRVGTQSEVERLP